MIDFDLFVVVTLRIIWEVLLKKNQLIIRLVVAATETKTRGVPAFAQFFIRWLLELDLSHLEKWDHWHISPYIAQLTADACADLRTSTVDWIVEARTAFEKDSGRPFPNVIEFGTDDLTHQWLTAHAIGLLLKEAIEEDWIETEWQKFTGAQSAVVQAKFHEFLRRVYRRGMFANMQKAGDRGFSGKFGETTLRVYSLAGRTMFTFARSVSGETVYKDETGKKMLRTPSELTVSFVAEEDDPIALSAGLQSARANLVESLAMIQDVITHWSPDKKKQKKQLKPDDTIGLGL